MPQMPKPAQEQQAGFINQLQSMSMEAESQAYGDQFQYPDNTGYDYGQAEYTGQYQGYDDGYAEAAAYPSGTLEEL